MQTRHGRIVRNVGKLSIWICYRNQGAVSRSRPTVRNIEIELLRDELTKSHRRDPSSSRVGVVNIGSSPVNLEWRIGGVDLCRLAELRARVTATTAIGRPGFRTQITTRLLFTEVQGS